MILGHWSVLLQGEPSALHFVCLFTLLILIPQGIILKAEWDFDASACIVPMTDNRLLIITFIYSMAFDFIVLCLTAYKLIFKFGANDAERPSLSTVMFTEGLIFFIIA